MRSARPLARIAPLVLALLLGSAAPLHAHDPGLSTLHASLDGATLEIELSLAGPDLRAVTGTDEALVFVRAGEREVLPSAARREPGPDGHDVLRLRFELPPDRPLVLEFAGFDRLPFGHKQHARVRDAEGGLLVHRILSAEAPRLIVTMP